MEDLSWDFSQNAALSIDYCNLSRDLSLKFLYDPLVTVGEATDSSHHIFVPALISQKLRNTEFEGTTPNVLRSQENDNNLIDVHTTSKRVFFTAFIDLQPVFLLHFYLFFPFILVNIKGLWRLEM